MADLRDPFDGSIPDRGRPPLQLDAPLVASVEPMQLDQFDQLAVGRDLAELGDAGPMRSVPVLDIEQQLHGAYEQLDPAALRRAALLRMIGLGRLASRTNRPG